MDLLNKRPQSSDTNEDIIKMSNAFTEAAAKNPNLKPSAKFEIIRKEVKKSIYAKQREKIEENPNDDEKELSGRRVVSDADLEAASKQMYKVMRKMDFEEEIYKKKELDGLTKRKANLDKSRASIQTIMDNIQSTIGKTEKSNDDDLAARVIIGDVVERKVTEPKVSPPDTTSATKNPKKFGKKLFTKRQQSIFAASTSNDEEIGLPPAKKCGHKAIEDLPDALFEDLNDTVKKVHLENLNLMGNMSHDEIEERRTKLLKELGL